jgi:hypothetical protein
MRRCRRRSLTDTTVEFTNRNARRDISDSCIGNLWRRDANHNRHAHSDVIIAEFAGFI